MKVYSNICVFFGMLLFSGIANGQDTYRKYMRPKLQFIQSDTRFNKTQAVQMNSRAKHIWINSLMATILTQQKSA